MPLTTSQRLTCKQEIAHRLSQRPWSEIDLHLYEFGATTTSSWSEDAFSYIIEMLKGIDEPELIALAKHLGVELDVAGNFPEPKFWGSETLRVFLSHLSDEKGFASELQTELSHFGISSFVAHEDIEPTSEWQNEIERALQTCDALLALLHSNFHTSTWTDQEIGFCLGRGVPVFSIRLGTEPYGLFGRLQAFSGHKKTAQQIAVELFNVYRTHPQTTERMANVVIRLFEESLSYQSAKVRCGWVEDIKSWRPEYLERLKTALNNNSQIADAWGVPQRIQGLLSKHGEDPQVDSPLDKELPF